MKKILVVDDSETNLVLLKAILEDTGYDVILTNSSKKALSISRNHDVDLILLDLLMPEMDGFSFLNSFKEYYTSTKEIPVIVVTAYANAENIKKTKDLGAYDVIGKPININHFLYKIKHVLDIEMYR
ncbi:MAG: response regulator [Bacteroidales bacterium]